MKSFVSGCFDLVHAGHIEFLTRAAAFGDLYVAVASDDTIRKLKKRKPVYSERERLFILNALECVHIAFVSSGDGVLDFLVEMRSVRPDVFVVNEEGASAAKAQLCEELGADYRVLSRAPADGLAARSTSSLLSAVRVPYRIDIAGGWMDQPFVSKHHRGAVITASIEPIVEFGERSGLATSTRRSAKSVWPQLSSLEPEALARILFAIDNPPGTSPISGSQDAIGIAFPGVARSDYDGAYWPAHITHRRDAPLALFLDRYVHLISLGPRVSDYDVLSDAHVDYDRVKALSRATDRCWNSLLRRDVREFGKAVTASFAAQISLFPRMVSQGILNKIAEYRRISYGWKLCGAGGGGYLMLITDTELKHSTRIRVRR